MNLLVVRLPCKIRSLKSARWTIGRYTCKTREQLMSMYIDGMRACSRSVDTRLNAECAIVVKTQLCYTIFMLAYSCHDDG